MLEPDREGLGQLRDAADRQQDAGHEARAVGRHVADRERLGNVAEDDLLVGDQARTDRFFGVFAGTVAPEDFFSAAVAARS